MPEQESTQFEAHLKENGYEIQRDKTFENSSLKADLYAFKKGKSFWIFFPYEDHIFVHFNKSKIKSLHEEARNYVNGLFDKPKWARYKVPNIVTVAFSEDAFSEEDKEFASTPAAYGVGGEKNSAYLIDTKDKSIAEAGVETIRVHATNANVPGRFTFQKVSPTNRVRNIILDFLNKIWK